MAIFHKKLGRHSDKETALDTPVDRSGTLTNLTVVDINAKKIFDRFLNEWIRSGESPFGRFVSDVGLLKDRDDKPYIYVVLKSLIPEQSKGLPSEFQGLRVIVV